MDFATLQDELAGRVAGLTELMRAKFEAAGVAELMQAKFEAMQGPEAVELMRVKFEAMSARSEGCDFATEPLNCLASTMANQLQRSIQGSPGGANKLSVGMDGGDITILPFGAMLLCVVLGFSLRVFFGRVCFMRKSLSSFSARLAIFTAVFACIMGVVKEGEAAMKSMDSSQGANFLPVTKLTTGGPYEYTRNPMYAPGMLLVLGVAVLADSLWMAASMSLWPLYLDKYVIPAEEALLRKLFGSSFDNYAAVVPRWFMGIGPEALLVAIIFCLVLKLKPRAHKLSGLKFFYFPAAARGDCARLALTLRKISFKDKVVAPADWGALKPTTIWGQMPYAELRDGTLLGQSYAIFRFIGKGTGLYPEDPLLAARVDECMDGLGDFGAITNKTGQGLSSGDKLKKRGAACKEGGDIYVACERLEACYTRAGTSGPFLTGELTIADLQTFAQVGWATSGFFDGVGPDFLAAFPRIQAVRKAVIAIPKIAAFYKAEATKLYMLHSLGGHTAKDCYATMLKSSRNAA